MGSPLSLRLSKAKSRRRHSEHTHVIHPLDLTSAHVLAPGLYQMPAAGHSRTLRSATPCHAAEVHIGWLSLCNRPETRVRCPECRRRWTVSQLGVEHALWVG